LKRSNNLRLDEQLFHSRPTARAPSALSFKYRNDWGKTYVLLVLGYNTLVYADEMPQS